MAPGGGDKTFFVICVRGNTNYGINNFVDNGDGTVTDQAAGLMWMQNDSGIGYNWEDALDYAETLSFAGYDDWRLPNAKELQSILDYTRSPDTTSSPAIDPVFNVTSITNEEGQVLEEFEIRHKTLAVMISREEVEDNPKESREVFRNFMESMIGQFIYDTILDSDIALYPWVKPEGEKIFKTTIKELQELIDQYEDYDPKDLIIRTSLRGK